MDNSSAVGYMIMSALDIGLDKEIIEKLVHNMKFFMDEVTEEKATKIYNKF